MRERRTALRYDLSLPVIIHAGGGEDPASHNGKTRDISSQGIYFILDDEPVSPGAELDFTVALASGIAGRSGVCIRATGRAVRIEKHAEPGTRQVGVAAVIERYRMIRDDAAVTSSKTLHARPDTIMSQKRKPQIHSIRELQP